MNLFQFSFSLSSYYYCNAVWLSVVIYNFIASQARHIKTKWFIEGHKACMKQNFFKIQSVY